MRVWGRLGWGVLMLGACAALLVAAWLLVDRAFGSMPPPSLLRESLARRLAPESMLRPLLASTQALDVSALLRWRPPGPPAVRPAATHRVHDTAALRQALDAAQAGDVIELAAGDYAITRSLQPSGVGLKDAPIVLRGQPGARLRSQTVEAIKLQRPYWVVEDLEIVGECAQAADCEHALHVVGDAHHLRLSRLLLRNFNAAIKVNGESGSFPDHGLLQYSLMLNDAPRPGDAPVTPFDLVAASHWRVEDNHVIGVAKRGGNRIAYGLFMKGGGEGGRFERNLVICAPGDAFRGVGSQIGIGFGGGLTGRGAQRDPQALYEHRRGLARNNVVLNCNDTALDVNQSVDIQLQHNSLLGSGGILLRGDGSVAELIGNLSEGPWYARRGSQMSGERNQRWRPAQREVSEALREARGGARPQPAGSPPTGGDTRWLLP